MELSIPGENFYYVVLSKMFDSGIGVKLWVDYQELADLEDSSFVYHTFDQTGLNLLVKMVKCIVAIQVSVMILCPFSTNIHCRLSAYFMNHDLLMAPKALHDDTPKHLPPELCPTGYPRTPKPYLFAAP